MKRLIMIVLLPILIATNVSASNVVLTWDAPDAAQPLGYKVYYGEASGSYTSSIDAGDNLTGEVTGLENGKTYFFAATAYYQDGVESGFSNDVSKQIPAILPPGNLKIESFKLTFELSGGQ